MLSSSVSSSSSSLCYQLKRASKLIGALTILLLLGCVSSSLQASGDTDDSFYLYMRPRLGHFSQYDQSSPFARVYEEYFEKVIRLNDRAMKSISVDDWRKVRPTGEMCVDFLLGLQVKSMVLSKPYEIVMLDACLDWLFNESDSKRRDEKKLDVDRLDSSRKRSLKSMTKDTKLKQIYETTLMKQQNNLSNELHNNIYDYIVRLLGVYSDNPKNGCHSLWLEAYNDFLDDVYAADCDEDSDGSSECVYYGQEQAANDPYLKMIAESTKQASRACYSVMQRQIRGIMETEYEHTNLSPTSLKERLRGKMNKVAVQSAHEKWAREMISILQLASGVNEQSPVNLGDVAAALNRVKSGDQEAIEGLMSALSEYAKNNVDMKDSSNDPNGRARYGKAMFKLCRQYTDEKEFLATAGGINMDDVNNERKPFDFYHIIYALVRLTNHEDILNIKKDVFEDDVIKNRWEALYLATFSCQIIMGTWGELDYDMNVGTFDVRPRPDWEVMIADWPIDVMAQKLPLLYPNQSGAAPSKPKVTNTNSAASTFGRKFKFNFKLSSHDSPADAESNDNSAAAVEAVAAAPTVTSPRSRRKFHQQQASTNYGSNQNGAASLETRSPSSGGGGGALAPVASLMQPAKESPSREPKIMSWESIQMFKKIHGRYPKLPDYYKNIYPDLPDDLSGKYPKEMPMQATPTKAPEKAPVWNDIDEFDLT